MPIIEILVQVPQKIMHGLNSGYYTRDAAGIIRWARGTDKAGQIVVHLREIGSGVLQPQLVAPNLLLPMGAIMAVQLAGFAYLGFQLKQIGTAIDSLHQDVGRIMADVQILMRQPYLDRLNRVAHGVEHLRDARFRPALLEDARKSFREARGEIRWSLDQQSPVRMVEYLPETELLLQGLAVSFAGEHMCLHKQRAEFDEIGHVCRRYSDIMSTAGQKLLQAPPIHKPPIQSSKYLGNFRAVRPLTERVRETKESIAGEEQFTRSLAEIEPTFLRDFKPDEISGSDKYVLALYP